METLDERYNRATLDEEFYLEQSPTPSNHKIALSTSYKEIFTATLRELLNEQLLAISASGILMAHSKDKDMAEAVSIVSPLLMFYVFTPYEAFLPLSWQLKMLDYKLSRYVETEERESRMEIHNGNDVDDTAAMLLDDDAFEEGEAKILSGEDSAEISELLIARDDEDQGVQRSLWIEKKNRAPKQMLFASLFYVGTSLALMLSTRPILKPFIEKETIVHISDRVFSGLAPGFAVFFIPSAIGNMILTNRHANKAMGISMLSLATGIGLQYQFAYNESLGPTGIGLGLSGIFFLKTLGFSTIIACQFKESHFLKSIFTRLTKEDCRAAAALIKKGFPRVFMVCFDLLAFSLVNFLIDRDDSARALQQLAAHFVLLNRLIYMAGSHATALKLREVMALNGIVIESEGRETVIKAGMLVNLSLQFVLLALTLLMPTQFNQLFGGSVDPTTTDKMLIFYFGFMGLDALRQTQNTALSTMNGTFSGAAIVATIMLWPGVALGYGFSQISGLREFGYPLGLTVAEVFSNLLLKREVRRTLDGSIFEGENLSRPRQNVDADYRVPLSESDDDEPERVSWCPKMWRPAPPRRINVAAEEKGCVLM